MKDLKNDVFNSPLSGIFSHEQKGPLWFCEIIAQCHVISQPWPDTFVYKQGCQKGGSRLPLGAAGDS